MKKIITLIETVVRGVARAVGNRIVIPFESRWDFGEVRAFVEHAEEQQVAVRRGIGEARPFEAAFGIELAYVCFGLTLALIAATAGVIAYEKKNL